MGKSACRPNSIQKYATFGSSLFLSNDSTSCNHFSPIFPIRKTRAKHRVARYARVRDSAKKKEKQNDTFNSIFTIA
jgi:hypothetical protein